MTNPPAVEYQLDSEERPQHRLEFQLRYNNQDICQRDQGVLAQDREGTP